MVSVDRGSTERARAMLQEALAIAAEIGSKPAGQSALEVTAGLAALHEEWERAARLFGAAEAQGAQTSIRRDPADEMFLAPRIGRARTALGTAVFDTAANAGRALGYDGAIAEARRWLDAAR